jgi:uncharacterized OB-fold protein
MYSRKGLNMTEYKKPLPVVDQDSQVFWEGCKNEKLLIQQCEDCKKHIFYPRLLCPHCMSEELSWKEVTGRGKIYSFTIARRAGGPAFTEEVPYVVALVDLDEGVRLMTNIINTPIENVKCDMSVEVIFDKVTEEITLPKFQALYSSAW